MGGCVEVEVGKFPFHQKERMQTETSFFFFSDLLATKKVEVKEGGLVGNFWPASKLKAVSEFL